jgi:hypothetical protein
MLMATGRVYDGPSLPQFSFVKVKGLFDIRVGVDA